MGVYVTLGTTTLVTRVTDRGHFLKLASVTGVQIGTRLWITDHSSKGELATVIALPGPTDQFGTIVRVQRGVDGTVSVPHNSGAEIWIGTGDSFYSYDPVGAPGAATLVSPWVNVISGRMWFAEGDVDPANNRWWQERTVAYGTGALGVRTFTPDPTVGT